MSHPTTVKELRVPSMNERLSTLQFIKNYCFVAVPFTTFLTKKAFADMYANKLPIEWVEDEEDMFVRLKGVLLSPMILAFLSWSSPLTLHTDASSVGVEVFLTRVIYGERFIISCAIDCFSRSDVNRGPPERKAMAVVYAIGNYRKYITCQSFTSLTDSSALTWLFRSRHLRAKLDRRAFRLTGHDVVLQRRTGALHMPEKLSQLLHI